MKIKSLIALAMLMFSLVFAQDNWAQINKITASSLITDEYFGESVAISGDYAIVGAPTYDKKGSAYIYHYSGGGWTFVQKLAPADLINGDHFGSSVAISEDYVIVGASQQNSWAGSVYIFENSGTWTQVEKITASIPSMNMMFGKSVSLSGDNLIVGTHYQVSNNGRAYIFNNNGTSWTQKTILLASDGAISDRFGYSVSISGDYAIVGAYEEDENVSGDANLNAAGSAYIFYNSAGSWTQLQKIVASDRTASDNFGYSVSMSGDYAIVSAYQEDHDELGNNYISGAGSAYIFKNEGTWNEVQKIVASDRTAGDYFGRSVSIAGNYAIIGTSDEEHDATGNNLLTNSGSAYIYKFDGNTWLEEQKIVASDRETNDQFGYAVAISGSHSLVGAHYEDPGNINSAGSAYLFFNSGDVSLSVNLSKYEVYSEKGTVVIDWQTESEINNLGFIVQKREKVENSEFATIASYKTDETLVGHGSTTEQHSYQYIDNEVQPGITYEYRLGDVDNSGKIKWHKTHDISIDKQALQSSQKYGLTKAFPNPFNPSINFRYNLVESGNVTLEIYNINGQMVETIVNEFQNMGEYQESWQPKNQSAGLYFVNLKANNQVSQQKIIYLK